MSEILNNILSESLFFGIVITLAAYWIGAKLQEKFKNPILNPLLISAVIIIVVLVFTGISYESYNYGAKYISFLLTPSTACLAVPMYRQFNILKKNIWAVVIGIISGIIAGGLMVFGLCLLFRLDPVIYNSLLPKSVTTAIAIGISSEIGGNSAVTVCSVVITGIFGAMISKTLLKLFRITEPVAKGLAIGNAAHAIGTARAMELGEIEGAMSSLSIVAAGVVTVGSSYVLSLLSPML